MASSMDRATHARFLEYREKFVYFGRGGEVQLKADEFATLDKEYNDLRAKGAERDDEEEVRFEQVARRLHRD